MDRDDIHIISKHSNWSYKGVDNALKEKVYSDIRSWKKFLQFLFIILGVGFTVSGILFFFAYNWADLNKFAKIGIVEGLIIVTTFVILFSNLNQSIKNIILTGTAVLVGVLFAVFGQIYQTGADAYDFFLGWTLFISLWVIVSNYPPLWLLFLLLINATFILYSEQVAHAWSEIFIINSLFLFNTLVLSISLYLPKIFKGLKAPLWFTNIIALALVSLSTIGITAGIYGDLTSSFFVLLSMAIICYGIGLYYGFNEKRGFYLSIIPFSIIIIISALLIKISDGAAMFFTVGLFIIVCITFLILGLIKIQKKWSNG